MNTSTKRTFPQDVTQVLCNPVYAGVGPYAPIVSDEEWIAAARQVIAEFGPDYFLSTLLSTLRQSLGEVST